MTRTEFEDLENIPLGLATLDDVMEMLSCWHTQKPFIYVAGGDILISNSMTKREVLDTARRLVTIVKAV